MGSAATPHLYDSTQIEDIRTNSSSPLSFDDVETVRRLIESEPGLTQLFHAAMKSDDRAADKALAGKIPDLVPRIAAHFPALRANIESSLLAMTRRSDANDPLNSQMNNRMIYSFTSAVADEVKQVCSFGEPLNVGIVKQEIAKSLFKKLEDNMAFGAG